MGLAEKLREIMESSFGITTDEELIEAYENMEGLDIGIFVLPYKEGAV